MSTLPYVQIPECELRRLLEILRLQLAVRRLDPLMKRG